MIARIISPWTGLGTLASPLKPQLLVDHPLPQGASFSDVTGQSATTLPPAPNLVVIEVRSVSQAWVDGVDADNNYAVLWSE
jgi:hypothetical protein